MFTSEGMVHVHRTCGLGLSAQATRFILNILYALVLYHCKSSCTGVNDI